LAEPGDEASSRPPTQEALTQQPPAGSGSDGPAASIPEASHATLNETEMRAIERRSFQRIDSIRRDGSLDRTFKTACIRQERIVLLVSQIFHQNRLVISEKSDISSGVDIYLTDLMERTIPYRNAKLQTICSDLERNGEGSRFFQAILSDIRKLDST
jgi:hypothetical protein